MAGRHGLRSAVPIWIRCSCVADKRMACLPLSLEALKRCRRHPAAPASVCRAVSVTFTKTLTPDDPMTKIRLLGGISPDDFLRDYWQKIPLLIREALPDFRGLLDAYELIYLSCQEDTQSRLVTC